MNSFIYRDARRQHVNEALGVLPPDDETLRPPLEQAQAALATDEWRVADRTFLAVGEQWLWEQRLRLKEAVDADPALAALGTPATLTEAQAVAIETIPHGPGGPPADYLPRVRGAIGNDEAVLAELLHVAHQRWLEQPDPDRPYPLDDVAVLLPLRLETLFDAPQSRFNDDPTRWQLLLRVIPDEASICRDNPHISADELGVLQAFWQALRQPGAFDARWLDGDAAAVAWALLCQQVTAPRAAWLVAAIIPEVNGDALRVELPADMPPAPPPNRVGGLPPRLSVWATTREGDGRVTRHPLGQLPMEAGATIDGEALTLPLPDSAQSSHDAWWNSWERAKAVGLGGEWLLDEGLTPETLEALYVIGIGDEAPDTHIRAQSAAGELGLLRLGVPTNSVHGAPAAELATDAAGWRAVARARLQQRLVPGSIVTSASGSAVERHLMGTQGELPFFPGADSPDDCADSQRMGLALWPALRGQWQVDVWEEPEEAFRLARWAFALHDDASPSLAEIRDVLHRPCEDDRGPGAESNLCPEGPLMPLRIGDQPYGLLPVTALSQWRPTDQWSAEQQAQQRVETTMAARLTVLRDGWAAAARRGGTVVGATTERFMTLLGRDALTTGFIERPFAPVEIWAAPYLQFDGDALRLFMEQAQQLYDPAASLFNHLPDTLYLTNGYWRASGLPLVEPWAATYRHRQGEERGRVALTRFLALLLDQDSDLDLTRIFEGWWVLDEQGEFQLRVLPNSLLIRLLVHVCQISNHWLRNAVGGAGAAAVLAAHCEAVRAISCELDQPAWNPEERDPESGEPRFRIVVPDARRLQLERALRATLDSAAHRIDPWITAFAWQRLKQHSSSPRRNHRLGVYGWVDGPFLGTPGPTDAGRLHTPSFNQTLAALILRDKFLSSQRGGLRNEQGRNPWEMNITSGTARLAEEIADEVRLGFHIYEIVGRQVEHIVGTHRAVKALRTHPRYAMRAERRDPNEVCNGIEALSGLLAGDAQFPLDGGQQVALQRLHDALDCYGDLLMADGIMQLVNRQSERAAETMDAAAGFSRPPSFEFLRTPPSGYQLESMVVAALPYASVSDLPPDAHPIRLAEPSLAAFIERQVGAGWRWMAFSQDDGALLGSITLAELGLAPLDGLALSEEFLSELARRTLDLPDARIAPPREQHLAQQLAAALGSRPAAGRDLLQESATPPSNDAEIYAELGERYDALCAACQHLIDELRAAPDDEARVARLRRALGWGITPISEPADREALFAALRGAAAPPEATPLSEIAERVATVLEARLAAAPAPADIAPVEAIGAPLPDHVARKRLQQPDGVPTLAQALATLAAPQSKLSILAAWTQEALRATTGVTTAQPAHSLDEEWLTVVAAVRPPLARLEALQLELEPPLTSWSSAPGDPWRTGEEAVVQRNLRLRATSSARQMALNERFVAAYGSDEAWEGERIAVGLIDSFGEAVPMPQRSTMAAVGFNAPSARPPQAILLAVPPQPRQRLDDESIQQIVAETRDLAHARAVHMEDVDEWQSATPTPWLQASGPHRARLEPYPLFT